MTEAITLAKFPPKGFVNPSSTKKFFNKCKKEKVIKEDFSVSRSSSDGHNHTCKECERKRADERKASKKEWNIDFI